MSPPKHKLIKQTHKSFEARKAYDKAAELDTLKTEHEKARKSHRSGRKAIKAYEAHKEAKKKTAKAKENYDTAVELEQKATETF